MTYFEGENIENLYSVIGCRIDLYFHDYKLLKEIDGNDIDDRSTDYQEKRKAIELVLS